jgi:TonB family protein
VSLKGVGSCFSLTLIVLFLAFEGMALANNPNPETLNLTWSSHLNPENATEPQALEGGQKSRAAGANKRSGAVRFQLPDPDFARRQVDKKAKRIGARTVPATATMARAAAESSNQGVVIPPAPSIVKKVQIGSSYGYRSDPFTKRPKFHSGVDIKAARGAPVGASHPGTVVFAGPDRSYGNLVIVDHGGGVLTYYAHLSSFKARVGDKVLRGSPVGYAGSTGRSTAPHLHYELRVGETAVNPLKPVTLDPSSSYFTEQAAQPTNTPDVGTNAANLRQAGKQASPPARNADTDARPVGGQTIAASSLSRVPPKITTVDFQPSSSGIGYGDRTLSFAALSLERPNSAPPPYEAERSMRADADNKAQALKVSSPVLQGKAITRPTPVYPSRARMMRVEGTVQVEVTVSTEGLVESARALSGHAMLVAPAVDAARTWRFEPTMLNGVPVRAIGVITFNFKLKP